MFRTCFRGSVCVAALLLGFGGLCLKSQIPVGRISGTVADPTGAAVAGAPVTITNTDTQAKRTVSTDGKGFYSMGGLPNWPLSGSSEPTWIQAIRSDRFNSGRGWPHYGGLSLCEIGELSQSVEWSRRRARR